MAGGLYEMKDKNTASIVIYVLIEEKEKIKKFCKHYGFTMSNFIRRLILKKIRNIRDIERIRDGVSGGHTNG